MANCLQDAKHSAQALGVPDALVHAVADRQRVALALLVEEHGLRLRGCLNPLVRGRNGTAEVPSAWLKARFTRSLFRMNPVTRNISRHNRT